MKGLPDNIKGNPPLWSLEALGLLPRVKMTGGGGEEKRAQNPPSFLHIK